MPEHDKLHVDYDRWRPGTESCRRQMIDEAEEHRDADRLAELESIAWRTRAADFLAADDVDDVRFSRELSFVPSRRPTPRRRTQTDAIEQYKLLERLPHGHEMIRRLEDWGGWTGCTRRIRSSVTSSR